VAKELKGKLDLVIDTVWNRKLEGSQRWTQKGWQVFYQCRRWRITVCTNAQLIVVAGLVHRQERRGAGGCGQRHEKDCRVGRGWQGQARLG
jgi:hypothetical protein